MEISRRGFLKLLAALPVAHMIDVSATENILPPLIQETALSNEVREELCFLGTEYELRFKDASFSICSFNVDQVDPYFLYGCDTPNIPTYIKSSAPSILSVTAFPGKLLPQLHKYCTEWIDELRTGSYRIQPVARIADLIHHERETSRKIASLEVQYIRSMQANLRENLTTLELELAITDISLRDMGYFT